MAPSPITGSTGNLGGRVARLLAAAGAEQRLLCRDPSRAPSLAGAEPVEASFADGDAVRRALDGLETVLMVSASESADRVAEHRAFVDAAAEAGVRHLVDVSFVGAAPDATFTLARDHYATEQHVSASGMAWTFARDDIARALAVVLLELQSHAGGTYDLTGPEAITLAEAAATIGAANGRDVSYVEETLEEAYASRASYGAPDWQVDAWVSTYTAIAAAELAGVTGDVERLTGRVPLSLGRLLAGSAG